MKNDEQYIKMSYIWASCSYAKKLKVGALIVKDRTIVSDGYNGAPPGFPNICEDERGKTYPYVMHAEANAILKLARSTQSGQGATLYITHSPCIDCAKLIIQAGIIRVVIGEYYHGQTGVELLNKANIKVEYYEPDTNNTS